MLECEYFVAPTHLGVRRTAKIYAALTLSGSRASSIISRRARASEYDPSRTSSSTCSLHGFIRNCQIRLPSAAACVRSVGVVKRKRGDLAEIDEVKRRMVELADGGGAVRTDVEDEGGEVNGKGSVWTGRKESEERICTTEV